VNTKETEKRIRAVVVDDEPLSRSNLTTLLRRDAEIEIVRECGAGLEAVAEIRDLKPDLVFLDVQMPECDGFDVLEMLGGDAPPAIVFVTAYDKYALQAFEVGALDYLLKPFDDDRFFRALRRAKERIAQDKRAPQARELLVVRAIGGVSFLKTSEIDWIEAADYYSRLHIGVKTHLLRRTMSDLHRELDPSIFCRIHRSTIVRLDRVRRLELNENGEYDVILSDGTRLRSSRRYRKILQRALGG
jgi:two-component system, LytTR family, response regulator